MGGIRKPVVVDLSGADEASLFRYIEKDYKHRKDRKEKNWDYRREFLRNIRDVYSNSLILSDLAATHRNVALWRQSARLALNGFAELYMVDDDRVAVRVTPLGLQWLKSPRVDFSKRSAKVLRKKLEASGGKSMGDPSNEPAS